jgi:BirA family transcriptional regulator, biotin operon repressor / biotin---[acetyl-CoA-carboxylase] ligase
MNKKIWHFKELSSTNDYAIQHRDSLTDRDVVVADIQTHGKGKQGRRWLSSNPNNMYLSVVLKQSPNLAQILPKLTLFSAHVLAEFIETNYEQTKHQVQVRKPNDVLIGHAKLAGILADASWMGNQPQYAIIGIGVNLNMSSQELSLIDQASTSLNLICGKPIPKECFIEKFLSFFFFHLDNFHSHNYHQNPESNYLQKLEDTPLPSQHLIQTNQSIGNKNNQHYQIKPGD